MRTRPSIVKTSLLFTLGMLVVAVIAAGLLGVYGIPVTMVVTLVGFRVFARWYHRRYYGASGDRESASLRKRLRGDVDGVRMARVSDDPNLDRGVLVVRLRLLAWLLAAGVGGLGLGAWVWMASSTGTGRVGGALMMLGAGVAFVSGVWYSWWVWRSFYSSKSRRQARGE